MRSDRCASVMFGKKDDYEESLVFDFGIGVGDYPDATECVCNRDAGI